MTLLKTTEGRVPRLPRLAGPILAGLTRRADTLLPALALAALLVAVFALQPRVMSYFGLNLLLNLAIPLMFATLAQMFVMTVGDLDLGIGSYVSFVSTVSATFLLQTPLLGVAILALSIAGYGLVGALIHVRNLPSIVVTLGMSFVWFGLAVIILPSPGGAAPDWLRAIMAYKPPLVPLPIVLAVATAVVVSVGLMHSGYGVILRGVGGNPKAVARAGWSLLRARVTLYMLAGCMGVLAGLTITGIQTSGDSNIATRFTLLSIAGAVLGGSEFVGGRVSPVGAVIGALTITIAGSFFSFLRVNPDWQVGLQGLLLIAVLALRVVIRGANRR